MKVFSIFTFFVSLIFTFSLGEIFYNSIDGTDFYRYFNYIEYFDGSIDSTSREQGLFYFWLISESIDMYDQFYVADKWEYIYSSAIQLGNFILYLTGSTGQSARAVEFTRALLFIASDTSYKHMHMAFNIRCSI